MIKLPWDRLVQGEWYRFEKALNFLFHPRNANRKLKPAERAKASQRVWFPTKASQIRMSPIELMIPMNKRSPLVVAIGRKPFLRNPGTIASQMVRQVMEIIRKAMNAVPAQFHCIHLNSSISQSIAQTLPSANPLAM